MVEKSLLEQIINNTKKIKITNDVELQQQILNYKIVENEASYLVNSFEKYAHRYSSEPVLIVKTEKINGKYFKKLSNVLETIEEQIDDYTENNNIKYITDVNSFDLVNNLLLYSKFIKNSKSPIDSKKVSQIRRYINNPTKYYLDGGDSNKEDVFDKIQYRVLPSLLVSSFSVLSDIFRLPFYLFSLGERIIKKIDTWTDDKLEGFKATESGVFDPYQYSRKNDLFDE